jgi:Uma2 family endonuclease
MATDPQQRLTIEDYLAFERQSEIRHDYLDGEVFAMTGASRAHNLIAGNIFREIGNQLRRRPCEVYPEAMRVRTPAGLFTYPDVVVVCGERRFDDTHFDTLLNPTLLVEVLSPSTEAYDRRTKSLHYRSIPSLAEYVLVAQDQIWLEQYLRQGEARQGDEWLRKDLNGLDQVLEMPAIGCTLLLGDIYERVFE